MCAHVRNIQNTHGRSPSTLSPLGKPLQYSCHAVSDSPTVVVRITTSLAAVGASFVASVRGMANCVRRSSTSAARIATAAAAKSFAAETCASVRSPGDTANDDEIADADAEFADDDDDVEDADAAALRCASSAAENASNPSAVLVWLSAAPRRT